MLFYSFKFESNKHFSDFIYSVTGYYVNVHYAQWRKWRGQGGGANAPLAAQMWASFKKWAPLIRLSLLPNNFINLNPLLVHINLFFAAAAVSCKALRNGFFKWY